MIVYDIQKLTKRYDGQATPANDQISLQINQGEIFGFLG
ncbi:MAG: ABC transporter ATP-binding protein, partial [Caldilineaceae bacterium]|nr:ABC transporter ATP-binding protein [Caldilineaceae bacterium]